MVKIRLRRMGTKARPFYRVVVAKSTAGRNGAFVEVIGTCNPVKKPTAIEIRRERALYWLLNGAQPSDTVAYYLKQIGVLDEFFAARPGAKAKFKTLDKRTAAISKESAVAANQVKAEIPAQKPEPAQAPPAAEIAAEEPPSQPAAAEVSADMSAEAPVDEPVDAPVDAPEPAADATESTADSPEPQADAPDGVHASDQS